ncbi:iron ABC transporter substrate-binding protein, partial [Paracoccaceae bacterium]|nr:iron ABC transporter substrate-binding protein [Paracoccaceae bacterium]
MLKCKYVVFGLVISIFSLQQLVAEELNVYSHRQPFLIQPFLDAFTQKTGIKTNVLYSSKGLAQRLRSEGRNSPADVVLTVDIGRLYIYRDLGLLAVVNSDKMLENVPSHMRAADNTWFALSKRSRVIITAKDRVGTDEIKKIEDLADPKWKGRICSRPGSHVYNRA